MKASARAKANPETSIFITLFFVSPRPANNSIWQGMFQDTKIAFFAAHYRDSRDACATTMAIPSTAARRS